jgi:hypothetical protein
VSSCTTGTVPHGPCIQETTNDGSSWGNLTNDPGAYQIYMDVASNTLFALGRDNNISYTTNDSSWTELSLDICDSEDTILPDLIAVTSGMLMALNHNGGDPGYPYYFDGTCWTQFGTKTFGSLSASPNSPYFSTVDSSGNPWIMQCVAD